MRALWELDPNRWPRPLRKIGEKELHLWLGGWLRHRASRAAKTPAKGLRHLLFALCDHYEPLHGGASLDVGRQRVNAWRERYPQLASRFRDAEGRPPRHSYFFPGEQYDRSLVEPLGEMVELGLGEVEVHLHHDGDTRESLRASLEKTLEDLGSHGLVPRHVSPSGGSARWAWAFIHGNWCLANARRDGRYCGVDDEMTLLHELGCYADFTFPAAPDQSQPGIVNAIYYPTGDLTQRRAYEHGERARAGMGSREKLLMIEGPLALARRPGSWKVRIESSAIDWSDPPTAERLKTWTHQGICVEERPEWVFVKVHTHGAPERNAEVLLGQHALRFHEALAQYNDGAAWSLHYVTAREMFNVARAAIDGKSGNPADFFDYVVPPPPRADGASQPRSIHD